ncbi:elongation factor 1-beta 2-like [Chenopodium quinoa]|uniref:elongation factor 1-beta 2-like n=1 Tax=Chenopodium quinoa TaxID=63459 RepID=UPI000B78B4CC|nr:elongation factor 1-beta 2-like [Chenopodium quinoa]
MEDKSNPPEVGSAESRNPPEVGSVESLVTALGRVVISFPGQAACVRFSSQGAPAASAAPAEENKEAMAEDDDDDMDLFGDETEEEKKAADERETAKKASEKKKERSFWAFSSIGAIEGINAINKKELITQSRSL